jgi:hypothetical protein
VVIAHDARFAGQCVRQDIDRYLALVSASCHSLFDRDTIPGAGPVAWSRVVFTHSLAYPSTGVMLHRPFHLEDVVHMRVQLPRQAADGVQVVHVDAARLGIVQVVTDVK